MAYPHCLMAVMPKSVKEVPDLSGEVTSAHFHRTGYYQDSLLSLLDEAANVDPKASPQPQAVGLEIKTIIMVPPTQDSS